MNPETERYSITAEEAVVVRDSTQVQQELHRRIEEIRTIEADDPSRGPLSRKDLSIYVGTTVLISLLGVLVMVL